MKKENKTEHCNWRFLVSVFLYFLSIFYILTCIISFCRETGKGIEHTWFWEDEGEDDGGAGFSASPCPLFLFGLIPLLSLLLSQYFSAPSYFLCFPPKLFHSYFFQCSLSSLCLSLPPAFGSSSGFYSQRTRVFLVSQRASRWRGLLAAIRSLLDLESAPLSLPTSPSFIITEYQLLQTMKWWKRRRLGFFRFGHWMFCSFVIKSPTKL